MNVIPILKNPVSNNINSIILVAEICNNSNYTVIFLGSQ